MRSPRAHRWPVHGCNLMRVNRDKEKLPNSFGVCFSKEIDARHFATIHCAGRIFGPPRWSLILTFAFDSNRTLLIGSPFGDNGGVSDGLPASIQVFRFTTSAALRSWSLIRPRSASFRSPTFFRSKTTSAPSRSPICRIVASCAFPRARRLAARATKIFSIAQAPARGNPATADRCSWSGRNAGPSVRSLELRGSRG